MTITFPEFVFAKPDSGFCHHKRDREVLPPLVGPHNTKRAVPVLVRHIGMKCPCFRKHFWQCVGVVIEHDTDPVSISVLGINSALGRRDLSVRTKESERGEKAELFSL